METGVPEHGTRLDWFNGYLSGATHLSSPELLQAIEHSNRSLEEIMNFLGTDDSPD